MAVAGELAKYVSVAEQYLSYAAGVGPAILSSAAMDVKTSITKMYL